MNPQLEIAIHEICELNEDEMRILFSSIEKRHVPKGVVLLSTGQICREIYWVETGYLRTWYDKDDSFINLTFTLEGEFAANLKSSKRRSPSKVNIESGEESNVWVFNLNGISRDAKTTTQLAVFIRRLAIKVLMASEDHSEIFKIFSATERYRHLEDKHPSLLQRIPLSHLASYLGMTRETLSRIRAKKY
jgi:CRP-like cAMP-binding protein